MENQPLSPRQVAACLEHTLLKADATTRDIARLCAEAREHHFHGVWVNGSRVEQARHSLGETEVRVVWNPTFTHCQASIPRD